MKKALALLVAIGLLSFGAMAFAHGGGYGGMMGGGYGYGGMGMMGGGYGYGGMMGGGGPGYGMMGGGYGGCGGPGGEAGGGYGKAIDPEKRDAFFKDTLKLRKELHEMMFELREAYFAGNEEKVEKLTKEMEAIREKIYESAKKHEMTSGEGSGSGRGGYGHMGPGYGGHMGGWR